MESQIGRSSSLTQPQCWRIVASNGAVLITSQMCSRKESAEHAIGPAKTQAAKANAVHDA